jgi:hypothetical protein
MAVSLETLQVRISRAGELQQAAEGLIRDLEKYSKESPDEFHEIRDAYLAKIASQQANLMSEFPDFHQWSKVESFLEKADTFSRDLEDAILNPSRAEFLGIFQKWLHGIGAHLASDAEAWLRSCLKNVHKASMAELKGKVEELVRLSEAMKGSLLSQAKITLENELAELVKRDKTVVSNIVEWIEKAEKAFSQGLGLLKAWGSIKQEQAGESFARTPVREIVERFDVVVDSMLDRKFTKSEGFDKAMEFWKERKGDIQKEWTGVKPRFMVIVSQYDKLSDYAESLLVKEIANWKASKMEETSTWLEGLTNTAGDIIEVEKVLGNIEANWSSLDDVSEDSKKSDLKELDRKLASMHSDVSRLATKPSLKEYLAGLKDLSFSYNPWLAEFEEVRRQWIEETKPWIDICKGRGLEPLARLGRELSNLQQLSAQSNTIGEITNKHLDLKTIVQEIRDILKESLSEEKVQILDKVVQLEAEKGEVLISDLKEKLGRLKPEDLHNVISLSEEDRVLSVKISTRGG